MELLENPQPTRQRNRKSGSDNCPLSSILVIMPLFRELTISLMQFQKSSLLMIVENSDYLILLNCVALIFSELFLAEQISLIVEKNASMVLLLISLIFRD